MKLFKLATIFTICLTFVNYVTAKSEPAIMQNSKTRFTQKLNVVSSTAKPATDYESIQSINQQPKQIYQTQQEIPIPVGGLHQVPAPQNLQQVGVVPQLHPQSQQQILQFIQRALFTSQLHNQPTAMIIIAQPAIPANVVYGNPSPAQHFMNYLQNNQQARYQYIQPSVQTMQQSIQQAIAHQPIAQAAVPNTVGNYQVFPMHVQYQQNVLPVPSVPVQTPSSNYFPATTRMLPTQITDSYRQPDKIYEMNHLNQIAQLAAQKYFPNYLAQQQQQPQSEFPIKSLPPIITGFENFTPEQQAKIKETLSAHFGAPLQPLPIGKDGSNQEQNSNQVASKYQTLSTRVNEFLPNQELRSSSSVPQPTYIKM